MNRIFSLFFIVLIIMSLVSCNNPKNETYNKAVKAFEEDDHVTAKVLFELNPDYKDSTDYIIRIKEKEDATNRIKEKEANEKDQSEANISYYNKNENKKEIVNEKTVAQNTTVNKNVVTRTYSVWAESNAIITTQDSTTGKYKYKRKCDSCGYVNPQIFYGTASGSVKTDQFSCNKCRNLQRAVIGTKINTN